MSRIMKSELAAMLAWRRPARSKTESRFVKEYIDSIPGMTRDGYGNRLLRIGDSPILWSCHTDSVHAVGGRQHVVSDGGLLRLAPGEKMSSCLGADCATGVWIMRRMALRGIPGLYIFHRDEEIGGLGSRWIAKYTPRIFDGIGFAIALDRRGKDSIITHQGARCCSDTFARSIMAQLPASFMPDDSGLFTDTANYTDHVGECSNLSVGYDRAHSPDETQDVAFAAELLEALCVLDPARLAASRAPGEEEETAPHWRDAWNVPVAWGGATNYDRLLRLIKDNPHLVADWLDLSGVNADDLAADIGA